MTVAVWFDLAGITFSISLISSLIFLYVKVCSNGIFLMRIEERSKYFKVKIPSHSCLSTERHTKYKWLL